MAEENFYQEFIQFSICEPYIAASLILGLSPGKTIYKNLEAPRIIRILDDRVNVLFDKITHDDPYLIHDQNIFFYVNRALNIGIDVHSGCIESILKFFLKLPKKDKKPFRDYYSHLSKAITMHKNATSLSREEKIIQWRETAQHLSKKLKYSNKKQLAEAVLQHFKNTDSRYLEKKANAYYSVGSILRNI